MTKPEPLDCCCPDDVRFTTVTTDGSISLATSTIGSAPAGTVTGALEAIVAGVGVGTSSAGVRPSSRVAVAPPATPPTITPIRRSAAPLGPVDLGGGGGWYAGVGVGSYMAEVLPPRTGRSFARGRGRLAAASGRTHHFRLDHLTERGTADLEVDVT